MNIWLGKLIIFELFAVVFSMNISYFETAILYGLYQI